MTLSKIKDYGEKEGQYQDLADFIEFCKVKGVRYFKSDTLEFEIEKKASSKIEEPLTDQYSLADETPADSDLLFASSEPLEWEPTKTDKMLKKENS